MARFKLFNIPQNKAYQYRPRYYDPDAEARDERIKRLQEKEVYSTEAVQRRISNSFNREAWRKTPAPKKVLFNIAMVRLLIAGIICALLFFLINQYADVIIEVFE